MPIDFKDQYFGCEIEMTGLTRKAAAEVLAAMFVTSYHHSGGTYDSYYVKDAQGKKWRLMSDSSILQTCSNGDDQIETPDVTYRVEMVSPKLEYAEMEKLQEVVRALRHAGAVVNTSCGMHVHVDGANHTPRSVKNALSIMYSKEDILCAALKVDEDRVLRWCQKVERPVLESIRRLPNTATMVSIESKWYGENGDKYDHYDSTRYHALNVHALFYKGTLEWRLFNSTLDAGEVKANIVLALAISAQAINQSKTVMRKTPVGDNPAFTFRTFLLRLGLIGPEYKNVRKHLLKNLPGDPAWRYDRSQYPCNQRKQAQRSAAAR